MGFFAKQIYKNICRAMLNAYKKSKEQHPSASERELCALALSLRPTWQRKTNDSFTFQRKGEDVLTIEKDDSLEDVIRNVIAEETFPIGISKNPEELTKKFREVFQVIDKEVK